MPAYRLQALLDIRIRAEEEAKEAFSAAVKALEKEKQALVTMQKDLERKKAERKAKVAAFLQEVTAKGGGISGFQQMNRFEQRLKDEEAQLALEIERQKEMVVQAEKLVEQRRAEMADAAKEKKAIEKHRDNWKAEVRKERMAKEELNQEEIGNTLHLQRVRAAEKKQ
ncbi:MAG: flagellar assembly protein FliH [Myxococcota bacterium]